MNAICEHTLQKHVEEILFSYKALCLNAEIAKRRVDDINRALEILTPEEQLVINGFFMNPGKNVWCDLCEQLHVERSMIYRHRATAIKKITMVLFGVQEVFKGEYDVKK